MIADSNSTRFSCSDENDLAGREEKNRVSLMRCTVALVSILMLAYLFDGTSGHARTDPTGLPLLRLSDFVYQGAFRLSDDTLGFAQK